MSQAHLLLVDDSPDVAVLVRALARRGGHRLTAAGDVPEALAALASDRPDLVLLDINLTGGSGLDLLRRLPAGERPAVALFCQPELSDDIAAGWEVGADYLVSKALLADPPGWQERIAAVMARAGGQTPAARLEWQVGTAQAPDRFPSPAWAAAFSRALQSPTYRSLGDRLLIRVVCRAWPRSPPPNVPVPEAPGGWLEEKLRSSSLSVADVHQLCGSLVDQLWCLHGAEVSATGEAALVSEVVPHLR